VSVTKVVAEHSGYCAFMAVGKVISIFPEISGKFPEIFTENFPPVQTFQITVYLLTSSLSVGFYSTPGL